MTEPAPEPPTLPLVVPPELVARTLGIPQPLDEDTRWAIEQAISDAQADVSAYLGYDALTPLTRTEQHLVPWMGGYDLTYQPVVEIVSETAETDPETGALTGLFTVTYRAGLDAASDPALEPIRRYVRAHAANTPTVQALARQLAPQLPREVVSASVEGQSVTYASSDAASTAPGSGFPGALPGREILDRWRIAGRRVAKRRATPSDFPPWPYDYAPPQRLWW